MSKTKVRVYDWPVRVFHWAFVGLFVSAFFITKIYDDDSAQYPFHMLLGMTLAFSVLLRIIWGLVGSRYARFTSFKLNPKELISYLKDLFNKNGRIYLSHNPASSWSAIIMMTCSLGLALTGYLMVNGQEEFFEEVHELFANLFVVSAIAHVAGIVFHTLRHKDPVGLSMITGAKQSDDSSNGIEKNYFIVGFIFLLLISSLGIHLFKNYNPDTKSLTVFKTTYVLGKIEIENNEDKEEDD